MMNNNNQNMSQIASMIERLKTDEESNAQTLQSLSQSQGANSGLSSQLTNLANKERKAAQQLQQISQMLGQSKGGGTSGTTTTR